MTNNIYGSLKSIFEEVIEEYLSYPDPIQTRIGSSADAGLEVVPLKYKF